MSIRTILAAAAIAATASIPAFASEGVSTPNYAIGYLVNGGQSQQVLVEGRNSDRVVGQGARVQAPPQAATSQNFAPIDTQAAINGTR
jgi:hypothetical protein